MEMVLGLLWAGMGAGWGVGSHRVIGWLVEMVLGLLWARDD